MSQVKRTEHAEWLDPLWYKDAIIYEVHVRSFRDSTGDGNGDFGGLAERLPYIRDLGATAVWLMPFYPSPLRDDGYDISDYKNVHPQYGDLNEFRHFLEQAHALGLKIITELVVNHTSDQHPWFQRARRSAPGTSERDFYVWSDTAEEYAEARVLFKDFETSNWTWDPVAKAYYWHRFYAHQPDLNYDHPAVREAMLNVLDFWFEFGIDGIGLAALPYLFEREGTSCENLPETYEFLRHMRSHVAKKYYGRMLLAEANQWPEDAAAYLANGRCQMAVNFSLMPRMFMAVRMEDRYPIIDILEQTPDIPEECQWAILLRNHDELTLEMVTDEERDYMYRSYATDPQMRVNMGIRRRLAPLLGNDRKTIELLNGLLFTLPGTPVIYYGDEIGMGDNVFLGDRNAVRTPMQWSSQRNAGFSDASSQRLFLPVVDEPGFHYEDRNVEVEQNDPNSLLWRMKQLIALRKRSKVLSRGRTEFLQPENRKVLAFLRTYEDERVLVVANLSRLASYVELHLPGLEGACPLELFGQTQFPAVTERPYLLTLAPHSFYLFELKQNAVEDRDSEREISEDEQELPDLAVSGSWDSVLQGNARELLEKHLPGFLRTRRWFGGKARKIKGTEIIGAVPMTLEDCVRCLTMVRVKYVEGEAETYVLGLAWAKRQRSEDLSAIEAAPAIVRLRTDDGDGVLYEALREGEFALSLLAAIEDEKKLRSEVGEIVSFRSSVFDQLRGTEPSLPTSIVRAEQSNTSVVFGDRLIMKVFRRVDEGLNPDLEIGTFLTQQGFKNCPPVAGAMEFRGKEQRLFTLAILQGLVRNEGDAWSYTLDAVAQYLEKALATTSGTRQTGAGEGGGGIKHAGAPSRPILEVVNEEPPQETCDLIGPYLESARLLGQRTAEMHVVLGDATTDPAFTPEPFSGLYQRSIYQSMRNQTARNMQVLRANTKHLPSSEHELAQELLRREQEILEIFRSVLQARIGALRTRIHGDYHLGQVLYTGKDFVIIDFEGEPLRSIYQRRIKRSPLRDVAGMLRSFEYASFTALFGREAVTAGEDAARLIDFARDWTVWVSAAFLKAYLSRCAGAAFIPRDQRALEMMLTAFQLDKAIYELGYEINNRPTWTRVPLSGILRLLDEHALESGKRARVA